MAKKKQKSGQVAGKNNSGAQDTKPKAKSKAKAKTEAKAKVEAKAEAKAGKKGKAQDPEAQAGVTGKVAQFREFLEESKVELKKVTFPTRKETVTTSTAVLILVFVMALFLGLVDLGLSRLIEVILS